MSYFDAFVQSKLDSFSYDSDIGSFKRANASDSFHLDGIYIEDEKTVCVTLAEVTDGISLNGFSGILTLYGISNNGDNSLELRSISVDSDYLIDGTINTNFRNIEYWEIFIIEAKLTINETEYYTWSLVTMNGRSVEDKNSIVVSFVKNQPDLTTKYYDKYKTSKEYQDLSITDENNEIVTWNSSTYTHSCLSYSGGGNRILIGNSSSAIQEKDIPYWDIQTRYIIEKGNSNYCKTLYLDDSYITISNADVLVYNDTIDEIPNAIVKKYVIQNFGNNSDFTINIQCYDITTAGKYTFSAYVGYETDSVTPVSIGLFAGIGDNVKTTTLNSSDCDLRYVTNDFAAGIPNVGLKVSNLFKNSRVVITIFLPQLESGIFPTTRVFPSKQRDSDLLTMDVSKSNYSYSLNGEFCLLSSFFISDIDNTQFLFDTRDSNGINGFFLYASSISNTINLTFGCVDSDSVETKTSVIISSNDLHDISCSFDSEELYLNADGNISNIDITGDLPNTLSDIKFGRDYNNDNMMSGELTSFTLKNKEE